MKPIIFENIDERVLVEFLEYAISENLIVGDIDGEIIIVPKSITEIAKEFKATYKALILDEIAFNNLQDI